MKLFLTAIAASALLATPALAAPCRDAHGKFAKCAAKTSVSVKTTKTSKTTTTTTGGKCRDAKGHFAKCGTPGSHPA